MTQPEQPGNVSERPAGEVERRSAGPERPDYGGLGAKLDEVDLEHAQDVGADPPGGLGTDIAGGHHELGQEDASGEGDRGPAGS